MWFRRGRLFMVSPDSLGTACPLSGRNSTYRSVQISETSSTNGTHELANSSGNLRAILLDQLKKGVIAVLTCVWQEFNELNLGGALGIAVSGAILNARTNFHFVTIASNLTPANGAMTKLLDDMVVRYGAFPGSPEAGHVAAIKQLWQLAYREASTLAYADAFRFIMIAFVIATLLVPLLRNVVPTAPASLQAH